MRIFADVIPMITLGEAIEYAIKNNFGYVVNRNARIIGINSITEDTLMDTPVRTFVIDGLYKSYVRISI